MSTADFTDLGTNPTPSTNSGNSENSGNTANPQCCSDQSCKKSVTDNDNDKITEIISSIEKLGGFAIPIELSALPQRFHLTAKQAREKAIDTLYNLIMSKIGLEVACLQTTVCVPIPVADAIAVKLRDKEYVVDITDSRDPEKKQLKITW